MILFYSPIHGFIHKVLVVAHEAGLADRLEIAPTYPLREGHDITALNPLNKVPTLALDDGRALYGSQRDLRVFRQLQQGRVPRIDRGDGCPTASNASRPIRCGRTTTSPRSIR